MAGVAFQLDGEAPSWHQWMEKGEASLVGMLIFLTKLRKRFGATVYDDPLRQISKLVQTDTMEKFRTEFEGLMTRITNVEEPMS